MLQSYETCCLFQVLNRLEPAPSAVSGASFLLSLPLSSGEKSKRCRPKLRNSRGPPFGRNRVRKSIYALPAFLPYHADGQVNRLSRHKQRPPSGPHLFHGPVELAGASGGATLARHWAPPRSQ